MVSHMTHKSHVKFICFNASMLNEFVDRLLHIIIIIIILQGALIDQRAVAAGKNRTKNGTKMFFKKGHLFELPFWKHF